MPLNRIGRLACTLRGYPAQAAITPSRRAGHFPFISILLSIPTRHPSYNPRLTMPVTLQTGDLAPRPWRSNSISSARDLFARTSRKEYNHSKRIIQSSFSNDFLTSNNVSSSTNGLVYTIFHAWSGHHRLTLRPEDVWFAILSQLNFYINAHAEELRSFFVAHDGQKELETIDFGTINTVDFGPIAEKMTHLIQKNVLDPELRTWIMPSFSTTTPSDRVVASILMMGALQKYFTYTMCLACGIPSVTLLGEKADWEMMVTKLDKIPQLGTEPSVFAELLRPTLKRFVQSFDTPQNSDVVDFWNRNVHERGGSGPSYLSGWVTAFCFWDEDGKSLYREPKTSNAGYELDGVRYHRVDTRHIPCGFASVPVKVDDNGTVYSTKMLAGSVGIHASSSGPILDDRLSHDGTLSVEHNDDGKAIRRGFGHTKLNEAIGAPVLDSLQPVTGWFMYEVETEDDVKKRQQVLEEKQGELKSMGSKSRMKYDSDEYKRYKELVMEVGQLENF